MVIEMHNLTYRFLGNYVGGLVEFHPFLLNYKLRMIHIQELVYTRKLDLYNSL